MHLPYVFVKNSKSYYETEIVLGDGSNAQLKTDGRQVLNTYKFKKITAPNLIQLNGKTLGKNVKLKLANPKTIYLEIPTVKSATSNKNDIPN